MNIPSIQITKQEMYEAMQMYLLTSKGIKVQVEKVETKGYPTTGFAITCKLESPEINDEVHV